MAAITAGNAAFAAVQDLNLGSAPMVLHIGTHPPSAKDAPETACWLIDQKPNRGVVFSEI